MRYFAIFLFLSALSLTAKGQLPTTFQWAPGGNAFYEADKGEITRVSLPDFKPEVYASPLIDGNVPLPGISGIQVSEDGAKALIFTNTRKVWRYETKGDYWVFSKAGNRLTKIGKSFPEASLLYAKLSPDGNKVAYVSGNNLYVDDLRTGQTKALTHDGTKRRINGTFDWAYEEEFDCRDGFRWSPDSKQIAYWQIDASAIRDFLMINNTDSVYSFTIPVEYPKVGEKPSPYKLGVVDVSTGKSKWMQVPGDPSNTYLPRMEFTRNSHQLVVQQLNRKQNESTLLYIDTRSGKSTVFYQEKDNAWIDIKSIFDHDPSGWDWISDGNEFIWISEKDGWRHAFRVSKDGKNEKLITRGDFDIIKPLRIHEASNSYYYLASPHNATQAYLYRSPLDGSGNAERLSPVNQAGSHDYLIAPDGKTAIHLFSNAKTRPHSQWVSLPDHQPLFNDGSRPAPNQLDIEFFKVTTKSGVETDAWLVKPKNFDPAKKYPIVFQVYGEPAASTVLDTYGTGLNRNYAGDMSADGYLYASVDNRGTPSPKGRSWRKAIYRNIGVINIKDQAEAAQAIFEKFPFIDTSRVAVHGHSGGGSSTLNLLFQYPAVFKTGIAVAAVANQLTYDNIYQERFMGLPQENLQDFINGSPITHAKHLEGNLLYIHGTGDDNVHYQNAEMLLNELIKHNKQFQFMAYPNRTHGIREGEGTVQHMSTLFTNFLKKHCPPGAK
ncbi:S9 family peptidase [Ravibacter arvi]|uniref:S9 family peptidase n=1 Tax=Ravibacter arvi TaxID=2051041 RepID=A0ABP8LR28_9BACT